MSSKRVSLVATAVTAAVMLSVSSAAPTASAAPVAPSTAPSVASAAWLTLVTGDRVSWRPQAPAGQDVVIDPAAGRAGLRFTRFVHNEDVYVLPADARHLVTAGRLDDRLFNVSRPVVGDDRTGLALIVTAANGAEAATLAGAAGATGVRRLDGVAGATAKVDRDQFAQFWSELTTQAGRSDSSDRIGLWLDDAAGRGQAVESRGNTTDPVRASTDTTGAAANVDLTLVATDHTGAAAAQWSAFIAGIDSDIEVTVTDPSGTALVNLPEGRYYLHAQIDTVGPAGDRQTHIVEPELVVDGARTIALTAAEGQPVGVTVDGPGATPGEVAIIFERITPDGRYFGSSAHGADFSNLFVRPSESSATGGDFVFYVAGRLAKPDGQGGFAGSPYLYHVQWVEPGQVPVDLIRHMPDSELATVQARLAATDSGQVGRKDHLVTGALPFTIDEFYVPDTPWLSSVEVFDGEPVGEPRTITYSGPRFFAAGSSGIERWNSAVFGPSFPPQWPWSWTRAVRTGNEIDVEVSLFTDQGLGRESRSVVDSSSTKLYRNGQLIGQSPLVATGTFQVPAKEATYRLEAMASRPDSKLATSVKTAWTFRSGQIDGTLRLPLAAIRFTPELDDRNRAPRHTFFPVPLTVQWQDASAHGSVRRLTVQASYNDGRHWIPVPVTGSGDNRVAYVPHLPTVQHVSLRAWAVDSAGNSVEQTVVRAYHVRH
ncbi:hypothetical protein [Micromonospora sp. LOL_021]|uniref:hypothetical protein n=1 Tax=Micromonospora sp. LOL_021 TaxID=3345417 RepID=UPI003A894035